MDQIVQDCIWNTFDLERCIKAMPTYKDKVMKHILSKMEYTIKILNNDVPSNPESVLTIFKEKYPEYYDVIFDCYNSYTKTASMSYR